MSSEILATRRRAAIFPWFRSPGLFLTLLAGFMDSRCRAGSAINKAIHTVAILETLPTSTNEPPRKPKSPQESRSCNATGSRLFFHTQVPLRVWGVCGFGGLGQILGV